jgi:hypothetical protein
MSLFYSFVKCVKWFGNIKISFFQISNPLDESTISKSELQADFLGSYISF